MKLRHRVVFFEKEMYGEKGGESDDGADEVELKTR